MLISIEKILNWLLPTLCVLCHMQTTRQVLCEACLSDLPWQEAACTRCGNMLSHTDVCGECIKNPPPYHHALCFFRYEPPIDSLILSLKFAENLRNSILLGSLMAEKISAHYASQDRPAFIIPVPLHKDRLSARGYNQALEIARPIAKKLNIPLKTNCCIRILPTPPQASTTAQARKKNMKHAFAMTESLQAKHVAIVDDVLTTGSTVAEIALLLKKSGVERVDVWCCARTVRCG